MYIECRLINRGNGDQLQDPDVEWRIILKLILMEWGRRACSGLEHEAGCCEYGTEQLCFINCGKFVDGLLRKDSVPVPCSIFIRLTCAVSFHPWIFQQSKQEGPPHVGPCPNLTTHYTVSYEIPCEFPPPLPTKVAHRVPLSRKSAQ